MLPATPPLRDDGHHATLHRLPLPGAGLGLAGCPSLGPPSLDDTRLQYNRSHQAHHRAAAVLTSVRLRYTDTRAASPLIGHRRPVRAQPEYRPDAAFFTAVGGDKTRAASPPFAQAQIMGADPSDLQDAARRPGIHPQLFHAAAARRRDLPRQDHLADLRSSASTSKTSTGRPTPRPPAARRPVRRRRSNDFPRRGGAADPVGPQLIVWRRRRAGRNRSVARCAPAPCRPATDRSLEERPRIPPDAGGRGWRLIRKSNVPVMRLDPDELRPRPKCAPSSRAFHLRPAPLNCGSPGKR